MVPINVRNEKLDHLARTFDCATGSFPFTYLGLPMGISRPRVDNLTNLSPYNPVVCEILTDFKPFHITAKIVLSLAVTIISYIKVRGTKYIGV
jgi:hypothetical protein